MNKTRRILVTSALPYANGSIHLGHILEYIQTDIWVRYQRMRCAECRYVCGDDAHGAAITIKAKNCGISPEALIAKMRKEHLRDFSDFGISFDDYQSTHSQENKTLCQSFYTHLKKVGFISKKKTPRPYDARAEIYLSDRQVRGQCPQCDSQNQFGDSCEVCGAVYAVSDLRNARSVLTDTEPVMRQTEHLFFNLSLCHIDLVSWLDNNPIQAEVKNKLNEWFYAGLNDWDITRGAPYFGFEIPGENDKFFYVWFDALIGYLAGFKRCCDRAGLDFWLVKDEYEAHHFIGKDISYFHCVFWPAILLGMRFRLPTKINCHGFLTINGKKMSKSRGTFITARNYLSHFDAEYLRYYFAARLNSKITDIDFNCADFMVRVNSDLIGKFVNIASRCAKLINAKYKNKIVTNSEVMAHPLISVVVDAMDCVAELYENLEYSAAMRAIMELSDKVNKFIDNEKPWLASNKEAHIACSVALVAFAQLCLYIKPVLPKLCDKVADLLNVDMSRWVCPAFTEPAHSIGHFEPLLTRVKKNKIKELTASVAHKDNE